MLYFFLISQVFFFHLNNYPRPGALTIMQEELADRPLYYVLDNLCNILHAVTPSHAQFRSALIHAGYKVSSTHAHESGMKTDAPSTGILFFFVFFFFFLLGTKWKCLYIKDKSFPGRKFHDSGPLSWKFLPGKKLNKKFTKFIFAKK